MNSTDLLQCVESELAKALDRLVPTIQTKSALEPNRSEVQIAVHDLTNLLCSVRMHRMSEARGQMAATGGTIPRQILTH